MGSSVQLRDTTLNIYRYKTVMKRKLFQILLMGAVTVSLGMFVSCKDTSGDWYQELNGKFADNATLQEVVDQHNQDINYLMGLIEDLQGQVGKCECDKDLMAQLKQFMNDMNSANVDADDLKNMKELMDLIRNHMAEDKASIKKVRND